MNSKRIQKHLIDRDDTMYYELRDGSERFYIDTYAIDDGGIIFSVSVFNNVDANMQERFWREKPEEIETAMRFINGDLRKWRVLKNGE